MSISPFDHPLLRDLFSDPVVASQFSADAELEAMAAFERALALAQGAHGMIPDEAAKAIAGACAMFDPDEEAIATAAARDGVVVPELVRQLRALVGEPHGGHVHFGATSQDVVDTALALRLARLCDLFGQRLSALIDRLDVLAARDGDRMIAGRTRMQQAIAVPAARRIASWRDPLVRHRERLGAVRAGIAVLHLGGAAGTLDQFGTKSPAVAAHMGEALGLKPALPARHSERDGLAAFASWLSLVTGSLGKTGQDILLMAQNEIGEIALAGGGGSSAMPHKRNPVGAEVLVALARFNAALLSGLHQALVHENERSGSAWSLEWLILPQMCAATGGALKSAQTLLDGARIAP